MTTFICGGSNSVRKGGWVHHFPLENENISIGAATSIMGTYRAVFTRDIKAGDTVIWEYALNDSNQAFGRARSYTIDGLVKYCEAIIRHCAERGARFIALILTPRARERQEKPDAYRRRLIRMLRHYEIPFVEVSRELRRRFELAELPDSDFFDDFHYATDGRVVKYIARRAKRLCDAEFRPVPADRDPVLLPPGTRIRLIDSFGAAPRETFANKLVTIEVSPAAALPLETGPLDHAGQVVGIFMITTSGGGVLELAIGDGAGGTVQAFDLSVAHAEPDFPKPVFKMFSVVNARAEPVVFRKGQSLRLAPATGAGEPLTDMGFAEFPKSFAARPDVRIAGILTEELAPVAAQ